MLSFTIAPKTSERQLQNEFHGRLLNAVFAHILSEANEADTPESKVAVFERGVKTFKGRMISQQYADNRDEWINAFWDGFTSETGLLRPAVETPEEPAEAPAKGKAKAEA